VLFVQDIIRKVEKSLITKVSIWNKRRKEVRSKERFGSCLIIGTFWVIVVVRAVGLLCGVVLQVFPAHGYGCGRLRKLVSLEVACCLCCSFVFLL
jgi:accessory gene regulator protein AgrB